MHCRSLLQPPAATHLTVLSAEAQLPGKAKEEAVAEYFPFFGMRCLADFGNAAHGGRAAQQQEKKAKRQCVKVCEAHPQWTWLKSVREMVAEPVKT